MQKIVVIVVVIMAFLIAATKIAKLLRGSNKSDCNSSACNDCPLKKECQKLNDKR